MKKGLLKGLTEEQIAKVKACKNQKELLALAKAEGVQFHPEVAVRKHIEKEIDASNYMNLESAQSFLRHL